MAAARQRGHIAATAPLLRGAMDANPELEVPKAERSPVASLAEKIVSGLSKEESLDNDLASSAEEDLANLQSLTAKVGHSKTALTAHKVQVQETRAQRAARYFAQHGMGKVGKIL